MPHTIDAKGQACPAPVILARQAIGDGAAAFTVEVDNTIAVENLRRLADYHGFSAAVREADGIYRVDFSRTGAAAPEAVPIPPVLDCAPQGTWSVFVGRDIIGDGDRTLGTNLMRMFFYTLLQGDGLPASVLFMNAGVKLPALDAQIIEHLRALEARGVEILVCGTCLSFYELADKLAVGTVSNMYEIVTRMERAGKVISL